MDRQLRLNRNGTTLDLTSSPYALEAGSWNSNGEAVDFRLVVQATSLVQLDRYAADVRRFLEQANAHDQELIGDAVYIETKTCDEVTTTAEFGATWMRKRISAGNLTHEDASSKASGQYTLSLNVSLITEALWRRSAAESTLEASSTSTSVGTDGSLTVPASATLTARRKGTLASGFTVRVRWAYSDNDCTFYLAEAGTYDIKAWYQASDNKLYMQDSAGTQAASSALSIVAGTETDLVFKWDPATPKMGIWVNGSANGTAATCVLDFGSYGSELISNGGFETGGTGGDFNSGSEVDDGTSDTFTSWSNSAVDDGANNKVEATATAQAGSYAVKLRNASALTYVYQSFAITAGNTYKMTVQARGNGVVAGYWYANYTDEATGENVLSEIGATPTSTSYAAQTIYFSIPSTARASAATLLLVSPTTTGICYYDAASVKRIVEPDTYQAFAPSTASQTLYSWQMWPAALTDAECAALYAWGRPEPELMYNIAASDEKGTNAHYKLYNVSGDAPGLLRLVLDSSDTDDQDQVRVGMRPLRVQTTHLWECESGTLGGDTANNVDADASAGNQARFTPDDTASATRVTVVICADPDDVAAMQGEYRLLLAGEDSAASAGLNLIKWRLVVAGQAEDYSDEYSFAAVSTRSLLDLGTFNIPPGAWPEETISAKTDIHAGSYITLEIAARNTAGTGVLDLDALYLFPAEREGIWAGDYDVSAVSAVIDHASDPPAAITTTDEHSIEFAGWATWLGDILILTPVCGAAGSLCLIWYRNSVEECYPNDTSDVRIYYLPRWRR